MDQYGYIFSIGYLSDDGWGEPGILVRYSKAGVTTWLKAVHTAEEIAKAIKEAEPVLANLANPHGNHRND